MFHIWNTGVPPIKEGRWKDVKSGKGKGSTMFGEFQSIKILRWNKHLVAILHGWYKIGSGSDHLEGDVP